MTRPPSASKVDSSWARPLPFRALFCACAVTALTCPITNYVKKKYKDKRGDAMEDNSKGKDEKTKTRRYYQQTFATLLDAVDFRTGYWKGPIKSEIAYAKNPITPYMCPSISHRPERLRNTYWIKPKGSFSPDAVIVRSRTEKPVITGVKNYTRNASYCVDLKFLSDTMAEDQFVWYNRAFPKRIYGLYFPDECTAIGGKTLTAEEQLAHDVLTRWATALAALLATLAARGALRTPAGRGTLEPAYGFGAI